MDQPNANKIQFYIKGDMRGYYVMPQVGHILRTDTKSNYTNINEVLILYNIREYFANENNLLSWTQEETSKLKQKVEEYGKIVGRFFAKINHTNVAEMYEQTDNGYIDSFWKIVSDQKIYKLISKINFSTILANKPRSINHILIHKYIVDYYNIEIRNFLLQYPESAEILLSIYETNENELRKIQKSLHRSLTIDDKQDIISNYLASNQTNLNYVRLIKNARNTNDFNISDKIRLKAKNLEKRITENLFAKKGGIYWGVNIEFSENVNKAKDVFIHKNVTHYTYSSAFIQHSTDPYIQFQNLNLLFEFLDNQNRITLVTKKCEMGVLERIIGVPSKHEYRIGKQFDLKEYTSYKQIILYNEIISRLNTSLEDILNFVFTGSFQERYSFAENARFSAPSNANSYFERVRLLAPELESIQKQFKLYVENGCIDFELLQISSSPTSIKDIPSKVPYKYIYFNEENVEMVKCSGLFFSDQTLLTYVEPFKEKKYPTFFNLLQNEKVPFINYEEHQKRELNYLISQDLITISNNGFIQITNTKRLLIFNDLYENEFASFYHYTVEFQEEVRKMKDEEIVLFDSSLFSRTEQDYFNYFLNKSTFTNGLDLRNSYLHGTQAEPNENQKHEYAYFTYLKLFILTILKIEDDLQISNAIERTTS
jgi:hypothetical protein